MESRLNQQHSRIVAMKQKAEGNSTVGTSWTDCATFDINTPIIEIIEWAGNSLGLLSIAVDQSSQIIPNPGESL